MADLAGFYPTDPWFNAVNFKINTPTLATTTFSGKSRRVGYGHQYYEFTVNYPTLTSNQAATVLGFLAQTFGPQLSFEIVLPELSYTNSGNPPSTTPLTSASATKGDKNVTIDNCGANKEVLKIGDFFKFDNHSKVYQATNTITSDGSGNATLFFAGGLVEDVPDNTDLTLTAVPFTVIALNDVQEFSVGIGGLTTLSVEMRETF